MEIKIWFLQQKRCVSDTNFHGQFKFIRAYSDQQIKRDIYKTLQKISRKGPGFSIQFITSVTVFKKKNDPMSDILTKSLSIFLIALPSWRSENVERYNGLIF